jgi:integrase
LRALFQRHSVMALCSFTVGKLNSRRFGDPPDRARIYVAHFFSNPYCVRVVYKGGDNPRPFLCGKHGGPKIRLTSSRDQQKVITRSGEFTAEFCTMLGGTIFRVHRTRQLLLPIVVPRARRSTNRIQWPATLATYVNPIFGDLPVQAIDVGLVMKAIEPIWTVKPETASRVRGRIESVLDWATTRGYRQGENPARWRGHLENLLPKKTKVRRVKHHAALPYPEIPEFMVELRAQPGIAARALEFAILTAGRTSEVIGARWDEINLIERLWTIPADRMKAGKEHRVPLSDTALTIVTQMRGISHGDFVFPGTRVGRPLSNMSMLMTLRRMNRGELTAHGFRSSFRDWGAERTSFPAEVAEMALAHTVGDKVEAAYRRGDMFDKRRQLGDAWASFCGATAAVALGVVL